MPTMTEPKVEERTEQPYVAVRSQVAMRDLGTAIPGSLGEVFGWLGRRGLPAAGAPFIRYLVIDMAAQLDIEVGVPVARAVAGEGRISAGVLPAGRYASLVYTGIDNGIAANAALLEWGAARGLAWDSWAAEKGEGFGARFESFLTDPAEEPDRAQWQTEVAIRVADEHGR
jgi:effector-binding domain-containing protein